MASSFNTTAGLEIQRELLVAYLNTGTEETPVWSAFGKRVTDSSEAFDWREETNIDILGDVRTILHKPIITQTFDPVKLDAADSAVNKVWELAVKDQDYLALSAMDMLIVHMYSGTESTAMFAERYKACSVRTTGLGGEGGGSMTMPIEVTYGGQRVVGTASNASGTITFS